MTPDLPFADATDCVAALRAGEVSSRQLLELLLDRVERFNPDLNAVVTLDVERARAGPTQLTRPPPGGSPGGRCTACP